MKSPPILENKSAFASSVFTPAALLREARRQKDLPEAEVPSFCILDPDGDLVRRLCEQGLATRFAPWACYHTELYTFQLGGQRVGIVGRAVGAPFAVLVAEQLFACGCRALVSLASAGQITACAAPPYFVVIDRALRDEGTSYHYAPPSEYALADHDLVVAAAASLEAANVHAVVGASWTTDAPFRETAEAIEAARGRKILAVEMEAAALYAFARFAGADVLCLAFVTNTMGQTLNDFEKGEADGANAALVALEAIAHAFARLGGRGR